MKLPWLEPLQADLWQRLQAGRLGHAPMLVGPQGVGKRILADWLLRLLLCSRPEEPGQACGQCEDCLLVEAGSHPDLQIVAPEEDRQSVGVDQVRGLAERLYLTSARGGHRVGYLPWADALNVNAANALLKTLEEPPAGVWLLLVSEHPASLPITIRSRCQEIPVRAPAPELAAQWLGQELPEATANDREAALELCASAPLAARELIVSGELEYGLQMLADLTGSESQMGIVERWSEHAALSWRWLARWMAVHMARSAGTAGWQPTGPGVRDDLPPRQLMQLWELALHGQREVERGVIRQDLLLGRWLLEWGAAQVSGS